MVSSFSARIVSNGDVEIQRRSARGAEQGGDEQSAFENHVLADRRFDESRQESLEHEVLKDDLSGNSFRFGNRAECGFEFHEFAFAHSTTSIVCLTA